MKPAETLFINVFRDSTGLNYSCQEFGVGTDGLRTLDEVKADIYSWLVHKLGEYVTTLSNDGKQYANELARFAADMGDAISRADNYDIDPKDYAWHELEGVIEDEAPNYKVTHCDEYGETYYTRRGF